MKIESEHIQEWIRSGRAVLVPIDTTSSLDEYLDGLAWNSVGTGLDWSSVDSLEIDLSSKSSSSAFACMKATALGNDPYVIFLYGNNEPGIACEAKFGIENLSYAFWKAPGVRYIFGANLKNGRVVPIPSHFAEFDGADRLIVCK